MNPYKIDIDKIAESKKITDERELMKLQLVAGFFKATSKMDNQQIMNETGLDKSDLSRLRALSLDRFSIDRILGILNSIGVSAKLTLVSSKKAS